MIMCKYDIDYEKNIILKLFNIDIWFVTIDGGIKEIELYAWVFLIVWKSLSRIYIVWELLWNVYIQASSFRVIVT